ncbi:MAG: polyphosphate kinase 1 [Burkholderiales bacterium]|nr:polyphosphate kinase 1 [Burkholderiales bacterium]
MRRKSPPKSRANRSKRKPRAGSAPARSVKKKSGRASVAAGASFHLPAERFLNRELALLEFNRRVLAYAEDRRTPLLERLRYLCIVDNNLDEFFEVRVAGLKAQLAAGSDHLTPDGLAPGALFRQISAEAHTLTDRMYRLLNETLFPALAAEGVRFLRGSKWNDAQKAWVKAYFFREVMPLLTPLGLDPAHPFPRLLNKSLNFVVELEGKDAFGRRGGYAIVQAPRVLPRVIALPRKVAGCDYGFVFLSSMLRAHVGELFAGMVVRGCHQFQLIRNSDLFLDEEELQGVSNLRTALQGELTQRNFGDGVRLEIPHLCPTHVAGLLLQQFSLTPRDLYQVNGPVNLVRLAEAIDRVDRPDLKFPAFSPGIPNALVRQPAIFDAMRRGDILLHHPFQSFGPVVSFIEQAACDPQVAAIKMTIYRTGPESDLMETLIAAARAGKVVTVIVELLARFDEEANINWATRLEEVGAHVVYGVVGHKTHAKMALVIRREENKLRRYAHLATGNYHPRTTRTYTDFGLLTCNEEICAEVNDVFMQLTGLGRASKLKHLWQSPFTLHERMLAAIRRETAHARRGKRARIIAKMNALLEPELIDALYEASRAGVKIDLIVRGVCALRPQLAGLSENIKVRSVIGRFLEHTRVVYFHNGGAHEVYLASADWMDRNFFRRVEVCFPVLDKRLKKRVIEEGLDPYLADNTEAWEMDANGRYKRRAPRSGHAMSAQRVLLERLASRVS